MNDLDWENLKTLRALSEAKTVRAAAAKLGVHHATVSRRIDQLEETLGARLFDRQPEGLVMTPAAEELVAVAGDFTEQLQASQRRLEGKDAELKGRVVLTMGSPMAETLFAPELPDFADRYPYLDLHIVSTYDVLDLSRREADIAVRLDDDPPPSLVGKRLFSVHQATYASRDYYTRLRDDKDQTIARWIGWGERAERFHELIQTTNFANAPVWGSFDDVNLQLACANAGLGLAILPCVLADKQENLVRFGSGESEPLFDLWLLTHNDLRHTAKIRAVMDFAERVLRKHKDAFEGRLPEVADATISK